MTTSGQIFIYKAFGITADNNFPLIGFESKQAFHDFVLSLVSVERKTIEEGEPYFVLNNPQLLPDSVRSKHQYNRHERSNTTNLYLVQRHAIIVNIVRIAAMMNVIHILTGVFV